MAAHDSTIFRLEQRITALEEDARMLRSIVLTPEMLENQRRMLSICTGMLTEVLGTVKLLQTRGLSCVARSIAAADSAAKNEPEQTPEERLQKLAMTFMAVAQGAADELDPQGE